VKPTKTPRPTITPRPSPTPRPTTPVEFIPAATREAVAISPVGLAGAPITGTDGMPWWNDAIFYEVFVRSFYDSDGDGVGDLTGLIEKLDYLNDGDPTTDEDLGVTGLWLMPVTQSPSYHGYDVTDYYSIDDEYGTNADFQRLMEEAHRRGIYVIVDMVLNHTSAQHPWFLEAQDPESDKRDWYVWSETQGLKGWHETESGYYFGIFWDQMPDLNYANPEVTAAMQDVVRFWLEDMGVDGFRLDAIKHLVEDGNQLENTPATHAWFEDFFTFYKGVAPQAVTVGEVWSPTDEVVAYIGDEVDLAFEFDMADAILKSTFSGRPSNVSLAQQEVVATYPAGQYATFLSNHDQNRTRSRLTSDQQAKLAATLYLTFPGVPFLYYGEEIGMQGTKPDEHLRRPMQWEPEGGFSTGTPWQAYAEDFAERNVAQQRADTTSLLHHYDDLLALRNAHEALRVGAWLPVQADHPSIYGYVRHSDDEILLVLVNLSGRAVDGYSIQLASGPFNGGEQPALLMGVGDLYAPPITEQGGFDAYRPVELLPPYASVVIQFLEP
jgi:glycosidase